MPATKKRKPSASDAKRPVRRSSRVARSHKMADSRLYQAIADKSFWKLEDDNLLSIIRDEFSDELGRLQNAYSVKPSGITQPKIPSISIRLYGKNFDEINRTLVGVLALRWLMKGDYDTFVGSQAEPTKLQRASFDWLSNVFKQGLKTPQDTYALVVSTLINDLGKDHALAVEYAKLENMDISNVNHDMILMHAVEAHLVPALDHLDEQHREDIIKGIELGSAFNFGQLAQGENAPASLAGLVDMRGQSRAFEARFMEQILDLSGSSGHEDWTCARKMIEPIFQSYRNVFDVANAIISGECDLKEGFNIILRRKLDLLRKAGFQRDFDISVPKDRAMLRIFCLGNTNNAQNAEGFYLAFTEAIDDSTRTALIKGLNTDGSIDDPAVQPTYAPAMFTKAVDNTKTDSREEKIEAVAAVLKYLARCFQVNDEELSRLSKGVTVIERDVRSTGLAVVESEEFKQDPGVLETADIPEAQVANQVKVMREK